MYKQCDFRHRIRLDVIISGECLGKLNLHRIVVCTQIFFLFFFFGISKINVRRKCNPTNFTKISLIHGWAFGLLFVTKTETITIVKM